MNNLDTIGAEVYAVLKHIPVDKYNKIPPKITNIFEKYKDLSYNIQIDTNKNFKEQNISKDAKDIIFIISLNYWLTESERNEVIRKLKENEKALNEKYDIEKIFKKEAIQNPEEQNTNKVAIVECKEKWYKKLINKIKSIFSK